MEKIFEFIKEEWMFIVLVVCLLMLVIVLVSFISTTKKYKRIIKALGNVHTEEVDALNADILSINESLTSRDKELDRHTTLLKEATALNDSLAEQLNNAKANNHSLESLLSERKEELAVVKKERDTLEEKYSIDINKAKNETNAAKEELAKHVIESSQEIMALRDKVTELTNINNALTIAIQAVSLNSKSGNKTKHKKTALEEKTRAELVAMAKDAGIKKYSKMKKDELIEALKK